MKTGGQYYKIFRAVINGRELVANRVLDGASLSRLKASGFFFLQKKCEETQQLILGAGNAIYPVERTDILFVIT